MKKTGAQILVECLLEQGVDTVFGYPGGSVLYIYDALYEYCDKIRHILTCHEQGAAHAADGYARVTGKVGVVIATSGPGATNLVTGIANAYMDSVPLVAITGNVTVPLLGRDSFQEVDTTGITMPITKHNFIVKSIDELDDVVRKAFRIAQSGRPGPVLIDLPKDITAQQKIFKPATRLEIKKKAPDPKDLEKAVEMIKKSKRPLIYSGGGVVSSGATESLVEFAEKTHIPVSSSVMGLGGFPQDHRLYTGMIGMHGRYEASRAASECDLIIAVGARFSDRVAGDRKLFVPKAQVLHIDIDEAEIDKNVFTHHYIIGDVKTVLEQLNSMVGEYNHDEWLKVIEKWKGKHVDDDNNTEGLGPKNIIEAIRRNTSDDAIIATDVGQHQMWTAQYFRFKQPRTFVTSGGLGTMGFGMGAAIGSKIAMPDRQVVLISGDGSFHMNMNELATAVTYDVPIVIVIMNNQVLGMVRQWQKMFYGCRYSNTTLNRQTDYVKLAEAFGAKGLRVTKNEEFEPAFQKALSLNCPVVIDCVISPDENVFPMIPPGLSVNEIIVKM